jgi:hypothetical protein
VSFEPLADRARWRIIYDDLLVTASTGQLLTYEVLATALGIDPEADRHVIQAAIRRAAKEYLEADKRALDVVPNKGYRVVEAPEHLRLARRHQQRASRQLVAGHSKTVNVDLTGLDPETRHAFEVVGRALALQMDFNRRLGGRQEELEDTMSQVLASQERSAGEIAVLRNRLERLESGRD